jgi:hypothetical protein
MSEAGLEVATPECQWRSEWSTRAMSPRRAFGICRWKAFRVLERGDVDVPPRERPWALRAISWRGSVERLWSAHRVRGVLIRTHEVEPRWRLLAGRRGGEPGCSWWTQRQLCRHAGLVWPATALQRRRGLYPRGASVYWCTANSGPRRAERRKPEACELGIGRMLVTTSRLQRLARGIMSSRRVGAFGPMRGVEWRPPRSRYPDKARLEGA